MFVETADISARKKERKREEPKMALKRLYYIGDGERREVSEDEGATWQEVTLCKVVNFNGSPLVWAPPGKKPVRRKVNLKHKQLVNVQNGFIAM